MSDTHDNTYLFQKEIAIKKNWIKKENVREKEREYIGMYIFISFTAAAAAASAVLVANTQRE